MSTGLGIFPYLVMLLIVLICMKRESRLRTMKEKNWNFVVALIPMFVLIGFKSENVGRDTYNYLNAMSSFESEIDWGEEGKKTMEVGFQVLMIALKKITDNTQSLLITLGLLTAVSLHQFIRRTATNWCLALYLFTCLGFFQFSMTGIRQTMAIDILLLSYPFIKNKKLILFMLVVGVAFLFHKSAVVFAPLFFISNMAINKKNTALMVIVMTVLFFFSEKILLTTADVMDYNYGIESTDNGNTFLMIVLIITVMAHRNRSILMGSNPDAKFLFNANYVSVLLWIIRMVSRTVERVSLYFMPYTYVLLEQYLSSLPSGKKGLYTFIVIILATALFLYRMSYQMEINNYMFCWQ